MKPEQRCCLSPGSAPLKCRYPAFRGKVEIRLRRSTGAIFIGFALNRLWHPWLNPQGTA
jgi:hypothetical protein